MSINVCVLGSKTAREEFCKSIAKKGSSDDFTMYNTNYQGRLINLVEPTRFPEKIVALINALFLTDFVVFIIDEINAEIGEQIVLLDLMAKKGCFVSDLDLLPYTKKTNLEAWPTVSKDEASRIVLEKFTPEQKEGEPVVFVDHSFEVKGIGSVLLGLVHQGTVKVHDNLICYPAKKELEVKSIQKNDQDVNEALCTDRLGLGIRKLKSEEVERGSILSKLDLGVVKELDNSIQYSKFATKDSTALHAFHCLQAVPCTLKDQKIVLEKELAIVPVLPIIFCDLNKKLRIIGAIK